MLFFGLLFNALRESAKRSNMFRPLDSFRLATAVRLRLRPPLRFRCPTATRPLEVTPCLS
jgi:hypothetical protein